MNVVPEYAAHLLFGLALGGFVVSFVNAVMFILIWRRLRSVEMNVADILSYSSDDWKARKRERDLSRTYIEKIFLSADGTTKLNVSILPDEDD